MQHFSIIFAICREALAKGGDPARYQVERLAKALESGDRPDEGELLRRLLREETQAPSKVEAFSPSALTASLPGEVIGKNTRVPVDRETSSPLVTLIQPSALPKEPPILNSTLEAAVNSLLAEWQHLEDLRQIGISPAYSCLIYGPPGAGKTQLALWLARRANIPVVLARLDGLMSSFLGTTSRNIGNLFQFANRHRALLLLDEFDAIAKLRDDPNEIGEIKRVVNTLLQNLDARRTIGLTIGITNHEKLLDPAIWRRFEVQMEIPKPEASARALIVARYMEPIPLQEGGQTLLSWLLDGCSGAEIEEFAKSIKRSTVVDGAEMPFLDRISRVAQMHAARISAEKRDALGLPQKELANKLYRNEGLNQQQLGEVFGVNRATISRWLKDPV